MHAPFSAVHPSPVYVFVCPLGVISMRHLDEHPIVSDARGVSHLARTLKLVLHVDPASALVDILHEQHVL